jgi:hypothetical protein
MKKILLVFISCVLIFINSCDPGGNSTTEIINNSTYDLLIAFEDDHFSFENMTILKGESDSFGLRSAGGYPHPKYYIDKIIFTDINTGDIIKTLEIDKDTDSDIFELLNVDRMKRFWYYTYHANFSLVITDELLQ